MIQFLLLAVLYIDLTLACAATSGGETVTTAPVTCGGVCAAEDVTLTPATAARPGSFMPTSSLGTNSAGCMTLTVTCDAGVNRFAFMQFNILTGGPEVNNGQTQVVNAVLLCSNSQWVYVGSTMNTVVTEVNCLGANQAG